MKSKYKEISNILHSLSEDGVISITSSKDVSIARSDNKTGDIYSVYEPCVCIITQGEKSASIGSSTINYAPGNFLISSISTPVTGRVLKASKSCPYTSIIVNLNPTHIFNATKSCDFDLPKVTNHKSALFLGKVSNELLDCTLRLVRYLQDPKNNDYIIDLTLKEFTYHLLNTDNGRDIAKMGILNSNIHKINKAIEIIKNNFESKLSINELSRISGMSTSTFHKMFKDITKLSPIQFQKRLRLQEARRLMTVEDLDVSCASSIVGYESLSQFSREYTRFFKQSPLKDIKEIKKSIIKDY